MLEKHCGSQTAERIATEAEGGKKKANSSLIMRDMTRLLQLLSTPAEGSHYECKYHRDQRMSHSHTTISSIYGRSIRQAQAHRKSLTLLKSHLLFKSDL